MRFVVTETFESDELKSTYLKGFVYTVFPDNKKLDNEVKKWLKSGKIKEVAEKPRRVHGQGNVT